MRRKYNSMNGWLFMSQSSPTESKHKKSSYRLSRTFAHTMNMTPSPKPAMNANSTNTSL